MAALTTEDLFLYATAIYTWVIYHLFAFLPSSCIPTSFISQLKVHQIEYLIRHSKQLTVHFRKQFVNFELFLEKYLLAYLQNAVIFYYCYCNLLCNLGCCCRWIPGQCLCEWLRRWICRLNRPWRLEHLDVLLILECTKCVVFECCEQLEWK